MALILFEMAPTVRNHPWRTIHINPVRPSAAASLQSAALAPDGSAIGARWEGPMTDTFEVGEIVVMWPGQPEMRILPIEGLSATVAEVQAPVLFSLRNRGLFLLARPGTNMAQDDYRSAPMPVLY